MPFRSRNLFKWLGATLLTGAALLLTFYAFRAPLLRTAANLWIVNDCPAHADAIVVLGGGLDYRPFAAARLYRAGAAPLVLVSQPERPPSVRMGLLVPEHELARQILLSNGVPATAIRFLGTNLTSTRDEAFVVKQWATETKAHSVLIPTDPFHTRRVRWIFSKVLRGTAATVRVTLVAPPRYGTTNWWQVEEGLIAFQNEVVKSFYYHLKY